MKMLLVSSTGAMMNLNSALVCMYNKHRLNYIENLFDQLRLPNFPASIARTSLIHPQTNRLYNYNYIACTENF